MGDAIKTQVKNGKNVEEALIEVFREEHPTPVESVVNVTDRISKLTSKVKDYIEEKEVPRE